MDREKIEKRLRRLEEEQLVLFAYRCSLRALPFLSYKNRDFDYWGGKEKKTHIVALFRAIDFAFLYLQKKNIDNLIDGGRAIAQVAYATAYAFTDAYAVYIAKAASYAASYAAFTVAEADAVFTAKAASYAANAAAAVFYGNNFIEKNIILDLEDLENNRDIIDKPLFEDDLKEFKKICLNFENSLKNIGFSYWADVFKHHIENNIDIENLKQRLGVPDEIVTQGGEAITSYLLSIKKKDKKLKKDSKTTSYIKEVKVHFVGNGYAGKSCLKDLIMGNDFIERETTEGVDFGDKETIEIETKKIGKVKAYLWDFGGQEKMYPVHKFFFSQRSVYLLVLDSRREDEPDEWLEMINTYAKQSKILIVFNKYELNSSFDLNRKFLKSKYPNIIGFYPLSCKEREKYEPQMLDRFINDFNKTIEEEGHNTIEIDKSWQKVKDAIQNELKDEDFISKNDYFNLCKKFKIDDPVQQNTLLKLLNNLGILLYYEEENLKYTEVINPKWVTNAVYHFLHNDKIIKQKGYFDESDFNRILDEIEKKDDKYKYPYAHRPYIKYIMEKFFVSFKIYKESRYIIPVLLKDEEPDDLPLKNIETKNFYIKYNNYFPYNILPDFICLNKHLIYNNKLWRTGVALKEQKKENYVIVRADRKNKQITISAGGEDSRSLLTEVRAVFKNQIHSRIDNLDYEELIPLPFKTQDGKERTVGYEELISFLKQGEFVYKDAFLGQFPINELLHIYEYPQETKKKRSGINFYNHNHNYNYNYNKTDININIELTQNVQSFIEDFNDLKTELEHKNPDLKNELIVLNNAVNEMEEKTEKEIKKSGVGSKFKRFFDDLLDKNSKLGKTLKGINKGYEIVSDLAEKYNKIAELTGLNPIPKIFLKKRQQNGSNR